MLSKTFARRGKASRLQYYNICQARTVELSNGLGFGVFLSLLGFSGLFCGFYGVFLGTWRHLMAAIRKVVDSHGNVFLVFTIQRKTPRTSLEENSICLEPFGSTVDKWSFREICCFNAT